MLSTRGPLDRNISPLALVVDGDAETRHTLADWLRAEGIPTDLVADARAGREWLRFTAPRYRLILLDVGPGTPGGGALLDWLRAESLPLATVVLTGAVEETTAAGGTGPRLGKSLAAADYQRFRRLVQAHFRHGGWHRSVQEASRAA